MDFFFSSMLVLAAAYLLSQLIWPDL